MKKLFGFVLIFLISIFVISAICEENQIDINTATKEELDSLYGIGPVKAEEIINSRPFDSVNDLINVYGIGEITLNKIKEQELACVDDKKEETEENDQIENEKESPENELIYEEKTNKREKVELDTIKLNAKTIKTENNKENSEKSNYAVYGLIGFCVLLGFLFILKKQKNYKTEFG